MSRSEKAAEELYEVFKEMPEDSFLTGAGLHENFPKTRSVDFDSEALYHFSRAAQDESLGKRGFLYDHFLGKCIQHAIDKGETDFEISTKAQGPFPYYVQAKGDKVRLALVGSLSDQGVKGADNMDVAVYGDAGDYFLLFSKNTRAYVSGKSGAHALSQTENCILDTETIGPNPMLAQNGKIMVRGDVPRKIHDADHLIRLFNEAEPLFGRIPPLLTRIFAKRAIVRGMKEMNLELLCAGKGNKYFKHVEYQKPDWIPKRIYSGSF